MCGNPNKPGCGKGASVPIGASKAMPPRPASTAAAAMPQIERWLGCKWVGVPDPIRRHIGRSIGLSQRVEMPGCGCTTRGIAWVGNWRASGGLRARMASVVVWVAPRGSAVIGAGLSVYLAFRRPGPRLRRMLGQTVLTTLGRSAPAKVTRVQAVGKIDPAALSKVAREARDAGKSVGEAVKAYMAELAAARDRSATTASQVSPSPSSSA